MTHIIKKGFNQRSQSLHFRKGQYDPNTQSVPDESFLNGDARDVQDGRYYKGDGVGSYVDTKYNLTQDYTLGNEISNFSWGCNFKTKISGQQGGLVGNAKFSGSLNGEFSVFIETNDKIRVYIEDSSDNGIFYLTDNTWNDGKWHSLVLVIDNNTLSCYIDNSKENLKLDVDNGGNGSIGVKNSNIALLDTGDNEGRNFEGNIFAAFLYNEVMTKSQINQYHNFTFDWSQMLRLWACDEGGGTDAFDKLGNEVGTINNANLSTFHASGDDAPYSFQNNVGYTYDSVNDRYIPRDESDKDKDVQGNSLQYKGKVPYTVYAKDSNCGKFDGVGSYVDTGNRFDFVHQTGIFEIKFYIYGNSSNLQVNAVPIITNRGNGPWFQVYYDNGGEELVIYNGSNLQSFSFRPMQENQWNFVKIIGDGNKIQSYVNENLVNDENINLSLSNNNTNSNCFIGDHPNVGYSRAFQGKLCGIEIINPNDLSDNGNYPFSEGNDNFVYDVSGNGYHGEIKNASLTDFWSERQDQFHYNIEHGFDLWLDGSNNKLFVPREEVSGDSVRTQGDTITGRTWDSKHDPSTNFHNGAETRFDTDANDPHFGDFKRAVSDTGLHPSNSVSGDDKYYIRKLSNDEADRFTLYLNDQVDPQKLKTELFTQ